MSNDLYYVDCINACRANPDEAEPNGEDVFCSECGESGIIYDLREGSVNDEQALESTPAVDTIPPHAISDAVS